MTLGSTANNAAGRLIERDDESGTVTYQYGLLGETTRVSRTIERLTPLERPVSATFSYASDYLVLLCHKLTFIQDHGIIRSWARKSPLPHLALMTM